MSLSTAGKHYMIQGDKKDEWYPATSKQIENFRKYSPIGGQGGYVMDLTEGQKFKMGNFEYVFETYDLKLFYLKNLTTGTLRAFIIILIPSHTGSNKGYYMPIQYPDY